jgi:predicted HD superfamily hydrolase involved in NAD metabolism
MDTARKLSEYFMPDRAAELSAAALLHDIAKELSHDEIAELIAFSPCITDEDIAIPEALHSLLGPIVIRRDFPEFANDSILLAVYNHTLGAPQMDTFSEIIFIADFVEDGRVYPSCIQAREYLFSNLKKSNSYEENKRVLRRAVYMELEFTVEYLQRNGKNVHSRSLMAKNAYNALI